MYVLIPQCYSHLILLDNRFQNPAYSFVWKFEKLASPSLITRIGKEILLIVTHSLETFQFNLIPFRINVSTF